jgi:hypothetical protein
MPTAGAGTTSGWVLPIVSILMIRVARDTPKESTPRAVRGAWMKTNSNNELQYGAETAFASL